MTSRTSAPRPFARRLLAWAMAASAALVPPASAAAGKEPDPITTETMNSYWRGDFAALERQYAELQRVKPLLKDGGSALEMFHRGLARVNGAVVDHPEPYLRELEALTLQWAGEHPTSALAHILHAQVLNAHAWSHRGGGFANTVPPQAWEQFRAYLRRAVQYLETHAAVAMTDSGAYVTLLRIGTGLDWTPEQLQVVADAGLKRNPHDLQLYFETMTALLPKWHDDLRMLDNYIRRVAEQTKADYGAGMYARLYAAAADEQFSHRLFEDSYADWKTMKQGYEDMHARYPDSPNRRNRFAYMACLAKDRPTLRALLAELGTKVDATQWGENGQRTLEGCQRWAKET